ncbi:hypothetical protein OO013_03855 [Mangrovivirga sp. M17]|uniref:Phosphate-selective porin O/P n=1 Tax=Mangrovivirga halotolerans TaxID=2993936 RepID=A0ABT3RMK8_9BACT|nr:hypothetical protein [Mangrovivirga halotolerans]MCX2742984.1 hypothetical protein [Mangrovivirga halotolerans]
MKPLIKISLLVGLMFITVSSAFAQFERELPYYRYNDKRGLNVFEAPKVDTTEIDGIRVLIGGDFAMQFQGLNQENAYGAGDPDDLVLSDLGTNFNLPTANLNLDVYLYDGLLMHLRTYLSARHHEESWVKGGHLQIDKLDFIKEGFMEDIMKIARLRIGLDEINYGDVHFRRSDNARVIFNPFVGNYIMDSFTTEAFVEAYLMPGNFIGMLAISNGKLNQNVKVNDNTDNKVSFYGKVGYDNYATEGVRFRITGSWYTNGGTSTGTYLYNGDRAGGRYYGVLHSIDGGNDFEPRFGPRFKQNTSFQINPFVKVGGLEFFGIFENISNGDDEGGGSFNQYAGEVLYRFGNTENFYVGGRYNMISGEMNEGDPTREISRLNIGGGWFMTKNVKVKLEYVTQDYSGDGWNGTKYQDASFDGVVLEAGISF